MMWYGMVWKNKELNGMERNEIEKKNENDDEGVSGKKRCVEKRKTSYRKGKIDVNKDGRMELVVSSRNEMEQNEEV